MPRKKPEEPKPKRQIIRQRKGTIDPRTLEEEKLHAKAFLDKIAKELITLDYVRIQALSRLRQIEALINLPTLDIPNEGE